MKYEEKVAEKVWRGKRSRVASAGCDGGDFREAGAEGDVTIGKNHKKIITWRSHSKKMLISMEG